MATIADETVNRYLDGLHRSARDSWARGLERRLSRQWADAEAALARARKVNPFVERYTSDECALPSEAPATTAPERNRKPRFAPGSLPSPGMDSPHSATGRVNDGDSVFLIAGTAT